MCDLQVLYREIRLITCECVICKCYTGKTAFQQQGQLPLERITPGPVFEKVGVDYAGPFDIKYGFLRKPTIVKVYLCLFVSLMVKAIHLELVSDLTTEAFIAALHRFICRRGLRMLIWSDHGTNFIGADSKLNDLFQFLKDKNSQTVISEFCTSQMIERDLSQCVLQILGDYGSPPSRAWNSFTLDHFECQADLWRIEHYNVSNWSLIK